MTSVGLYPTSAQSSFKRHNMEPVKSDIPSTHRSSFWPNAGSVENDSNPLIGQTVLARRIEDGMYYMGHVRQTLSRNKLLVLFDPDKRKIFSSNLQEVSANDVIGYFDALRHPIIPGDKVLAPSENGVYKPAVVLQGSEQRNGNGSTGSTDLVLSQLDDTTSCCGQRVSIWIPPNLYERLAFELKLPYEARKKLMETTPVPSPSAETDRNLTKRAPPMANVGCSECTTECLPHTTCCHELVSCDCCCEFSSSSMPVNTCCSNSPRNCCETEAVCCYECSPECPRQIDYCDCVSDVCRSCEDFCSSSQHCNVRCKECPEETTATCRMLPKRQVAEPCVIHKSSHHVKKTCDECLKAHASFSKSNCRFSSFVPKQGIDDFSETKKRFTVKKNCFQESSQEFHCQPSASSNQARCDPPAYVPIEKVVSDKETITKTDCFVNTPAAKIQAVPNRLHSSSGQRWDSEQEEEINTKISSTHCTQIRHGETMDFDEPRCNEIETETKMHIDYELQDRLFAEWHNRKEKHQSKHDQGIKESCSTANQTEMYTQRPKSKTRPKQRSYCIDTSKVEKPSSKPRVPRNTKQNTTRPSSSFAPSIQKFRGPPPPPPRPPQQHRQPSPPPCAQKICFEVPNSCSAPESTGGIGFTAPPPPPPHSAATVEVPPTVVGAKPIKYFEAPPSHNNETLEPVTCVEVPPPCTGPQLMTCVEIPPPPCSQPEPVKASEPPPLCIEGKAINLPEPRPPCARPPTITRPPPKPVKYFEAPPCGKSTMVTCVEVPPPLPPPPPPPSCHLTPSCPPPMMCQVVLPPCQNAPPSLPLPPCGDDRLGPCSVPPPCIQPNNPPVSRASFSPVPHHRPAPSNPPEVTQSSSHVPESVHFAAPKCPPQRWMPPHHSQCSPPNSGHFVVNGGAIGSCNSGVQRGVRPTTSFAPPAKKQSNPPTAPPPPPPPPPCANHGSPCSNQQHQHQPPPPPRANPPAGPSPTHPPPKLHSGPLPPPLPREGNCHVGSPPCNRPPDITHSVVNGNAIGICNFAFKRRIQPTTSFAPPASKQSNPPSVAPPPPPPPPCANHGSPCSNQQHQPPPPPCANLPAKTNHGPHPPPPPCANHAAAHSPQQPPPPAFVNPSERANHAPHPPPGPHPVSLPQHHHYQHNHQPPMSHPPPHFSRSIPQQSSTVAPSNGNCGCQG